MLGHSLCRDFLILIPTHMTHNFGIDIPDCNQYYFHIQMKTSWLMWRYLCLSKWTGFGSLPWGNHNYIQPLGWRVEWRTTQMYKYTRIVYKKYREAGLVFCWPFKGTIINKKWKWEELRSINYQSCNHSFRNQQPGSPSLAIMAGK